MTRDHQRDGVGGASACHGSCCGRPADRGGDLPVGARAANRDRLQRAPDLLLKRGRPNVQRQVEVRLRAVQVAHQRRHRRAQSRIVPRHRRGGEFAGELRFQRRGRVAEPDRAQPLCRARHQQPTER